MSGRTLAIGLGALLVLAAVPAIRHLRERPPAPQPAVRLMLHPPDGVEFGAGGDTAFDLALSPDGRGAVFAGARDGQVQLWRHDFSTGDATPLPGTAGGALPAFAPGGGTLVFFADGALQAIDLETGVVSRRAEAPAAGGASVGPGGRVLFAPSTTGPIVRLAGDVEAPATHLQPGDRGHVFPAWLGDEPRFLYLARRENGRHVLRLGGGDGDDVEVARSDSHGLVRHGRLLQVRDGTLLSSRFDVGAGRVTGEGVALALDVGVDVTGRGAFDAVDRLLAWMPPVRRAREIRRVSLGGDDLGTIGEPADYWQVRRSPDGRTAAVTILDPLLRTADIRLATLAGGPLAPLTRALASDTDPVWSADGARVLFRSLQDGQPNLFARAVRAAPAGDQPVLRSALDEVPTDWTPEAVIFHARHEATGFDILRLQSGETAPVALVQTPFNEIDGRLSPDRRWLAYSADDSGRYDVYVAPAGRQGTRTRVSTAGGVKPRWSPDGRFLFFVRGDELLRVAIGSSEGGLTAASPVLLTPLRQLRDYDVAGDGNSVLAILPVSAFAASPLRVIVSWAGLHSGRIQPDTH